LADSTATSNRLRLLQMAGQKIITSDQMTVVQAIAFFESLLDCTALSMVSGATRSVHDPLVICDVKQIGAARDRRADLSKSGEAIEDWFFHLLVRSWLTGKGFTGVKDL